MRHLTGLPSPASHHVAGRSKEAPVRVCVPPRAPLGARLCARAVAGKLTCLGAALGASRLACWGASRPDDLGRLSAGAGAETSAGTQGCAEGAAFCDCSPDCMDSKQESRVLAIVCSSMCGVGRCALGEVVHARHRAPPPMLRGGPLYTDLVAPTRLACVAGRSAWSGPPWAGMSVAPLGGAGSAC